MHDGDTTTRPTGVDEMAKVSVAPGPDGATVVALSGELDHEGVERVGSVVLRTAEAAEERLVIDTADVSFVDSAGLRLLLRAHQTATGRGVPCTIDRPSPQMSRLLSLTGLDELIGTR